MNARDATTTAKDPFAYCHCGAPMPPNVAFCQPCLGRLPESMRRRLRAALDAQDRPGFRDAYRVAVDMLS